MSERVAHWLRPNSATRVPRRVVCLDSEAHFDFDGKRQEQTFRLAVASFDQLDTDGRPSHEPLWLDTDSPRELWTWVGERTSSSHRTVVFAHKLDYDLRLTRALELLPELGWQLKQWAISNYSAWAFLRRGGRSLYLVDSLSHLPQSLDQLAGQLDLRKPPLPRENASDAVWRRRCRADVEILRAAVLRLVALYREHDLGDFRTTGPAQASAAFRHRFLESRTLLVHDDAEALAAERRAAWAGRAEVWRWGKYEGPLYEYDFDACYARIGERCELPAQLLGQFYPSTLRTYERARQTHRVLADVELVTTAPTVPCEQEGRIVWPVGAFATTLWDCELELARREGATIEIRRLWAYRSAPLLREWARWILAALAGEGLGADRIGRLVAKEWSRSLIGRFGLRYSELERLGALPESELALCPVADLVDGVTRTYLYFGRTLYEQAERRESPNSTPAVMGYVMAAARVQLWEALRACGEERVLSVDTDGLIVDGAGAKALERYAAELPGLGLRRKATYARAELRGPRNLDLDLERRVAGVPRRAERLAPGRYRGEVWESLPAALRRGRADRVVVTERAFEVSATDPRRLHLPGGETAPLVVGLPEGREAPDRPLAALTH